MKKNYNIKKTISMKQFVTEFGNTFSNHMKDRLLELELGCVLIRKEETYRLNLKHVEHIKYDSSLQDSGKGMKENVYGQFIVIEEILYYAQSCTESKEVMQAPVVTKIYNGLSDEGMISVEGLNAKKIDDSNIDFVMDSILAVFPEVSKEYLNIVKGMLSLSRR